MAYKKIVNCQTGEVTTVPLTPEEIAAAQERTTLELVETEKATALTKLQELDAQRIRPLAEIALAQLVGEPVPLYSKAKLADIELRASQLREKLK